MTAEHTPIRCSSPHAGGMGIGEATVLQVLRAADLLVRLGDARVFGKGLTQAQFNVLMVLKRYGRPALSQKEMQKRLVSTKGNISIHVANLSAAGYVRKQVSEDDSRVHRITLTAKGRRALARLEPEYMSQIHTVTDGLPARQLEAVRELLATIQERCHGALSGSGIQPREEGVQ